MPASAGRRALEVEGDGLITIGTLPQLPQGDIPIKFRLRLRAPHKPQTDPTSSSGEEENTNSEEDDSSTSGSDGSTTSTSCDGHTSSSGAGVVRTLRGRWRRCVCCGCFTYEVAVRRHSCPRHGSSSGRRRSGPGPDSDDPPSPRTREAIVRLAALKASHRELPIRLPTPPSEPPSSQQQGSWQRNVGSSQADGSNPVSSKDASPSAAFKLENTSSSSSCADLLWSGESNRLQETPSDRSQQTSDSHLVRRRVRYPLHNMHEPRGHHPRTKTPSVAAVNSRLLTLRVPSRTARGPTPASTQPMSTYHSHCGEQLGPGPRRHCSVRAATLHGTHPRSLLLADTPSAPSERQRRQDAAAHPPALSLSGLVLHQRTQPQDHNH